MLKCRRLCGCGGICACHAQDGVTRSGAKVSATYVGLSLDDVWIRVPGCACRHVLPIDRLGLMDIDVVQQMSDNASKWAIS
jgi:hypothetical protein